MDDARIEIILKWVEENGPVVKEVQASLTALTAQTAASNAAASAGAPAWLAWAGGILAASLALSPFLALALMSSPIVASFAVAGDATMLLLGGLAAGFAAIGAAVLFLGGGGGVGAAAALSSSTDKLTTAQEALQEFNAAHSGSLTILQQQQREQLVENVAKAQTAYNDALARSQGPVGTLLGQLGQMKDAWAAQAAPMAAVITQWVSGAIPAVTQLGTSLMTWFGDRLPGALSGISRVLQDLTPTFTQLGQFLGRVFDHNTRH